MKNPYIFVFLSYWKNFVGTENRVWIIHGKQAIRVRAIEVILYIVSIKMLLFPQKSTDVYLFSMKTDAVGSQQIMMMMIWCFRSLSILFKSYSYRDDGRMTMKGSMQYNAF